MKLFLIKIMVFVLPILIGLVVMEILLRKIPNDYSYKNKYLSKNAKNLEVLYLGSSHAFYGVNPKYDDKKSFNASHISQSIDLDYEILKKFSDDFETLDYIFMPIDYFSLFNRTASGSEPWRIKNYNIYYGLNMSSNLKYYSEVFTFGFKKNLSRLSSYFVLKKEQRFCTEHGYGNVDRRQKDLKKTGKEAAERHTIMNKSNFEESVSIINEIIEFSKVNDTYVVFYTSPAYPTYVNNLDDNQLEISIKTIDSLCNKFNNCHYINLLKDERFIANDFYDADHLNSDGAKKLTRILNQEIDGLLH